MFNRLRPIGPKNAFQSVTQNTHSFNRSPHRERLTDRLNRSVRSLFSPATARLLPDCCPIDRLEDKNNG